MTSQTNPRNTLAGLVTDELETIYDDLTLKALEASDPNYSHRQPLERYYLDQAAPIAAELNSRALAYNKSHRAGGVDVHSPAYAGY